MLKDNSCGHLHGHANSHSNAKARSFRNQGIGTLLTALLLLPPLFFALCGGASVQALTDATPVGSIAGKAHVNQMGGFGYQIPFDLPLGPGGFTPSLGLAYRSQTGNGLVGVGWSVTGLSSIQRCPTDVRIHGERKSVSFDSGSDEKCLDGARLYRVESPTYDPPFFVGPQFSLEFFNDGYFFYKDAVEEYRLRNQPSIRVLFDRATGGWMVQTADGRHYLYAFADAEKEHLKSKSGPWVSKEVRDHFGNGVAYEYGATDVSMWIEDDDEESPGGRPRIDRVHYGTAEVLFHYDEYNRPDPVRGFRDGVGVSMSSRLARIDVRQSDELVHVYKLLYNEGISTGRSRLASIALCTGKLANDQILSSRYHKDQAVTPR